jgi:hypothetical protein
VAKDLAPSPVAEAATAPPTVTALAQPASPTRIEAFTPSAVLALQRTAGNVAVCRALARAAAAAPAAGANPDAGADAALDADFEAVKSELDRLIYLPAVEDRVIAILRRRATAPATGKETELDKLLVRLRTTTTTTGLMGTVVSYYDLLFQHFDRAAEIRQLRDQHSTQFVGAEPLPQASLLGTGQDDFLGSLWEDVKSGAVERRIYAYCRGLFEAGVGLAEGLAMLLDPLQWPKLAAAIGNLPTTVKVLWLNKEKLWDDFLSAKPEEQARIIGRVVGEIEIQLGMMAAAGGAAKAGTATATVPAVAEASVAAGGVGTLGRGMQVTIDLGKLGSAGQGLVFMAQVGGDANQAKGKADSLKAQEGEKPAGGSGSEPPKEPPFKELSKAEYDKLSPAQQQDYLTQWMKAHKVERIIRSAKHHAWPEYLGGPAKQPLLSLDELKHIQFHSLLDTRLPRARGAAYYAARSPAQKLEDIATLRRIARDFDLVEGTKISEQLNAVLKGTPYEHVVF